MADKNIRIVVIDDQAVVRQGFVSLIKTVPDMEVIASIVEIKPGESSELHFHHGVEVFYVIQGAKIQAPGANPGELVTGTSNMNLRNVKHGSFKVLGETPLKLFTAHIVDKGKPLYDYSK